MKLFRIFGYLLLALSFILKVLKSIIALVLTVIEFVLMKPIQSLVIKTMPDDMKDVYEARKDLFEDADASFFVAMKDNEGNMKAYTHDNLDELPKGFPVEIIKESAEELKKINDNIQQLERERNQVQGRLEFLFETAARQYEEEGEDRQED